MINKQQFRNSTILSRALHRFMVQAFQDPPLCSSTENSTFTTCIAWYSYRCLMLILFLFHYGSRRFHIVKCTVQGQTQCYVWNFVGIFTSNISFIVVQRTSVSTFRSYLKVEWTVWEKTKMNFLWVLTTLPFIFPILMYTCTRLLTHGVFFLFSASKKIWRKKDGKKRFCTFLFLSGPGRKGS
jgi:hypothetical protein